MKNETTNLFDLFKRPMFWRVLLAFVILGGGQKVFGAEEALPTKANRETKTSWSVVIAPDNPESEGTISTFTSEGNAVGDQKDETQNLVELNDPSVLIVPENTPLLDTVEAALEKGVSGYQPEIEKPIIENNKIKLNYNQADYVRIYNSIPFSRSQYDANPTYRHDATMEILLGQPKPVNIIKQEIKTQTVSAPFDYILNPYVRPWYLTNRYPSLGSRVNYSLWRPSRPYYYGLGSGIYYQSDY